jgi:hypothetical protein
MEKAMARMSVTYCEVCIATNASLMLQASKDNTLEAQG